MRQRREGRGNAGVWAAATLVTPVLFSGRDPGLAARVKDRLAEPHPFIVCLYLHLRRNLGALQNRTQCQAK